MSQLPDFARRAEPSDVDTVTGVSETTPAPGSAASLAMREFGGLVASLRELIRTRQEMSAAFRDLDPNPLGSRAMDERSRQAQYATEWSEEPLFAAHELAFWLLVAAEGHIGVMCTMIEHCEPLPPLSDQVLARAAIQACCRSRHLSSRGISDRQRIARVMNDWLASIERDRDLPEAATDRARSRADRALLLAAAEELGFARMKSGDSEKSADPPQVLERRPRDSQLARDAFDGSPQLGRVVWQWFSQAEHGAASAMREAIASARVTSPAGGLELRWGPTVRQVRIVFTAVFDVYQDAVSEFAELYGWDTASWRRAYLSVLDELGPLNSR